VLDDGINCESENRLAKQTWTNGIQCNLSADARTAAGHQNDQVASSSASKGCGLDCRKPNTASTCDADTCCEAYTCIQQYQTVTVLSGHTDTACCTTFVLLLTPR